MVRRVGVLSVKAVQASREPPSSEANERQAGGVQLHNQRSADDYCRSLKLEESDFVMPRKNFPLWRLITNDPLLIKAKIHEWSDGEVLCKNTPETTQCKQ
ncbi:hypothetical protein G4B88_005119 [Cannabis sativa]|uniref:Uncharacterized protein n=1 Tax=Cannabis sativa TaxID=3483 RepID=A0A7J6DKF2_CANSA|nr:hypothetical protein G4B88_005119 [Cannabis sativa]